MRAMETTKEKEIKFCTFSMFEDDYKKLVELGGDNRSAFFRRLIRQEWDRHHPEQKQEEEQE